MTSNSTNDGDGLVARIDLGRVQNERNEMARRWRYLEKMLHLDSPCEFIHEAPNAWNPAAGITPVPVPRGDAVVAFDDHLSFEENSLLDEGPFIDTLKADCTAAFGELDGLETFDIYCERYDLMRQNPRYGENLLERQCTARRIIRQRLAEKIEADKAERARKIAEDVGLAAKLGASATAIAAAIWEIIRSRSGQ